MTGLSWIELAIAAVTAITIGAAGFVIGAQAAIEHADRILDDAAEAELTRRTAPMPITERPYSPANPWRLSWPFPDRTRTRLDPLPPPLRMPAYIAPAAAITDPGCLHQTQFELTELTAAARRMIRKAQEHARDHPASHPGERHHDAPPGLYILAHRGR